MCPFLQLGSGNRAEGRGSPCARVGASFGTRRDDDGPDGLGSVGSRESSPSIERTALLVVKEAPEEIIGCDPEFFLRALIPRLFLGSCARWGGLRALRFAVLCGLPEQMASRWRVVALGRDQLQGPSCGDRKSAEGSRCARCRLDDEGSEKSEPDELGRTKWSQTNQPSRVKQSSIHRIEGEIAADAAVRTGSLSSPPSTEAAAPVTFSARRERATRKKIRQRRAGGED